MEEKQLDFNQPLLSVRRFSSTASTTETENKRKTNDAVPKLPPFPVYKSELKSGPVRNPGTVPFVWEQTPGRPKNGSKPQTRAPEKPPVVPKLPPGRILNVKLQKKDKGSQGTAAFRSHSRNGDSSYWNIQSLDTNVSKEESSKDMMVEKYSVGSEDSHEACVNAVDTLSQTESFFYNCRISGVSELDGPALKPSGSFAMDPQTLDFMMGRFLPAAKAVASENSHYSGRKQPVAPQQPRQINNRVINAERRHTIVQNSVKTIPYHGQSDREEESEDEDSDAMEHENSSPNVGGFFPCLRLQNSFGLLNPVPGMRKQAQPPVSSVHRAKVKSSYAACCCETEIKNAVYEPRSTDRFQPTGLHGFRTKLKSASNQITCTRDSKKLSGSPLQKRRQHKSASPSYSAVSQNDIHEEKENPEISKDPGVNGPNQHAKWGRNFQKLLAIESKEWESESASPMAEKTLYIDYVHMVKPQSLNSSPSGKEVYAYNGNDDVETVANAREIEETASMDSSAKDGKHLDVVREKAKVRPGSLESVDSGFLSLSDRSIRDVQMDVINDSKTDRALGQTWITFASPKAEKDGKIVPQSGLDMEAGNLESSNGLVHDSIALGGAAKLVDDGKNKAKNQLITKTSNQEARPGSYPLLPLPPPSPKSPSEPWLKRALPAVSLRNSSKRSYFGMHAHPRVHASKTQFFDQKWQTIVKSSSVQSGNSRVSEELLAPIPEA